MTTTPLPTETRPKKTPAANLEPAICNPPQPVPEVETCPDSPARRVKGKIANLPKDQRDAVNKLLLDGSSVLLFQPSAPSAPPREYPLSALALSAFPLSRFPDFRFSPFASSYLQME